MEVSEAQIVAISTCTGEWRGAKVRFELRNDSGIFRWYFPDGSRTSVFRDSAQAAGRAMMHHACRLAQEYSERS